jgi:acetyl-CoA carboxylase carboxyl transferase subunit alpha
MKISAQELLAMKIVDRIIPEPPAAPTPTEATMSAVGDVLEEELKALESLSPRS